MFFRTRNVAVGRKGNEPAAALGTTVPSMGPISGDPHLLRAGRDYPVWTSRLPEGYVELDEVRVEFS